MTDSVTGASHCLRWIGGKVDFDAVVGLMSLCSLIQMEHLLDIRSYQQRPDEDTNILLLKHDVNRVPDGERIARAHARGQAIDIMEWLLTRFTLNGSGLPWDLVGRRWSLHHMMSVVHFQSYCEGHWRKEENKLDSRLVGHQVSWYHKKVPVSDVDKVRNTKMDTVAWPWVRTHTVECSAEPFIVKEAG
jgi:hypothetical protein